MLAKIGHEGEARRALKHTHRLRATESPLFYFEFQAPNRFVTTILDGTPADLVWNRIEGGVWVQT